MTTARTPEIDALLDACASGPVLVARPDRFDVVLLSADAYADLLDRSQHVAAIDADDPLLDGIGDAPVSGSGRNPGGAR